MSSYVPPFPPIKTIVYFLSKGHRNTMLDMHTSGLKPDHSIMGKHYRDDLVQAGLILRWQNSYCLSPIGQAVRDELEKMREQKEHRFR